MSVPVDTALEALRAILMQATRRKRASDLKRYLVTDLEIIEQKAERALASANARSPDDGDCPECGLILGLHEATCSRSHTRSPDKLTEARNAVIAQMEREHSHHHIPGTTNCHGCSVLAALAAAGQPTNRKDNQ